MKLIGGLDEIVHRRAIKRWTKIGDETEDLDRFSLAALRKQAEDLRERLDRVIEMTDHRLASPVTGSSDLMQTSLDGDWIGRPRTFRHKIVPAFVSEPQSGASFGNEINLFHDAGRPEVMIKQRAGQGRTGAAPYGLEVDTLDFDGSFLSLAFNIDDEIAVGLITSHIVQIDLNWETESLTTCYARLNVQHGPNTEQITRSVDIASTSPTVEFDLAYSDIHEERVERVWVDVIFERPRMSWLALRDMIVSRRLRAEV
ncbi:DUF6478 family protein [Palleronia caenipelagi]|uniref:Uncharacterized protein n=1 Tax=Palleronia caenipelagi TaxID=2489174 RepID=A0A547Q6H6_9RHOB|nr:DUF6478 family protein [Palleronia caenipelagi]TRD21982.1 hypothetical protein FEV53_06295 [Palleronia caenipelagi]